MAHIYEHNATSILPHLITNLPYSITCLRRIQHGQAYPSPTAKVLATFPPGSPPDGPWLAARVDLFMGRETQITLYSNLETRTSIAPIDPVTQSSGSIVSTFAASPAELDTARDQLLALLHYIKDNLLPEYLASLPAKPQETTNNGVPLIPPPSPTAFLIGALHTGLFSLLMRDGRFDGSGADPLSGIRVHRFDNPPYYKYFFPRDVFGKADAALPEGYRYQDRRGRVGVLPGHLDLVQSRTHIPRPRAQLMTLPGMALYYGDGDGEGDGEDEDEMPIAWGFLGVDGSVATLHVEPEHRGKGLAFALSKQVMHRGMASEGPFGPDRTGIRDEVLRRTLGDWVHSDVAQYNKASRRVMEKIGGEVKTSVMWVVLELCD